MSPSTDRPPGLVARGAALVAMIAIVVLPPVALLWLGHLPADLPSDLGWLLQPDDGSVVLQALTVLGWFAWLVMTGCLLIELVNRIGGHQVRLPGLGWPQALAAGLIAVVMSQPATAIAEAPAAQTVVAQAASAPVATPGPAEDETPPVPEQEAGPTRHLTVTATDDLWSIAERELGDGGRWHEIVALNPGLDPLAELHPGQQLRLPVDPHLQEAPPPPATVVVEKGDSLSSIAEDTWGDADLWPLLYHANQDQIADPDQIDIGWRLEVPTLAEDDTASPEATAPAAPAEVPQTPESAPEAPVTTPAPPVVTSTGNRTPIPDESQPTALVDAGSSAPDGAVQEWGVQVAGLAALAIVGALATRRRWQLQLRPVGHRIPADSPETALVLSRLERLAFPPISEEDDPESPPPVAPDAGPRRLTPQLALGRALVGWHADPARPAPLVVRLGPSQVTVIPAEPTDPPDGWRVDAGAHHLGFDALPGLAEPSPSPLPALATLGTDGPDLVLLNLEAVGHLGMVGDAEQVRGASAALLLELSCRSGPGEIEVLITGEPASLVTAMAAGHVRWFRDATSAAAAMNREADQRRQSDHGDHGALSQRLTAPDTADAWRPWVALTADGEPTEVTADPRPGLCWVDGDPNAEAVLDLARQELRTPIGSFALTPQSIDADARAALTALFAARGDDQHEPAWWAGVRVSDPDDDDVATVTPLRPRTPVPKDSPMNRNHPTLCILGPVTLEGCRGPRPPRAPRQCIEYATWLLEHPGLSSRTMADALAIAEGTRRSNMCRLRAWLGNDDGGEPYLPEAYSGRIGLAPAVTSDWKEFQALVALGLSRTPTQILAQALDLVRGAPLADVAPGDWYWAEGLRVEMAQLIRDVGHELGERALVERNVELARWAIGKAQYAAPHDEQLRAVLLRAEHQAGNHAATDTIIRDLATTARQLGVDLSEETVTVMQDVMLERARARA
ncbi:LysM peptidoglycan-binding domain-containing protein [Parenemella sanctibonifatiensis]|uniref:LysM domain-containing protein n=1 Tax=Parenemella sanctibonifatiensis TaxID=2016505 RepID=A0A255ELK7_9ACTN|nr:LysM peptidoglycan-binding domain-containing protein [Parenemella sanctibonifatiensis]OYN90342.1 hypothetical protein CGZ91_09290 [Parenemella sanctibonifatiensis]